MPYGIHTVDSDSCDVHSDNKNASLILKILEILKILVQTIHYISLDANRYLCIMKENLAQFSEGI